MPAVRGPLRAATMLSLVCVALGFSPLNSRVVRPAGGVALGASRLVAKASEGDAVKGLLKQLDDEMLAFAEAKKKREEEAKPKKSEVKNRRFGARLDADIASENLAESRKGAKEEHEKLFDAGLVLMQRGEYKEAVKSFTRATAAAPGGLTGRKGGQYAIYLAQALQADNRRKEAVGLLERCESHPDSDVRKIADAVLYIMRAPELKLGGENFVTIPKLEENDNWSYRPKQPGQQKDPPPEKYSLEWYVLEAQKKGSRPRREQAEETSPAALASLAVLGGTAAALLLASGS